MSKEFLTSKEKINDKELVLMLNERFLKQIVDEVVDNTLNSPNDPETGGYILGIRDAKDKNRNIYVPIASFTPKDDWGEIEKLAAHLSIGGPLANLYRKWQVANWQNIYPTFYKDFPFQPDDPNTKLTLLGIWHRHPGNMLSFSNEDSNTIDRILKTPGKEDFIFPIVILGEGIPRDENSFRMETAVGNLDINFYYRSAVSSQTKILTPEIYNSQLFPNLANSPWYAEEPSYFKKELKAFQKLGYKTGIRFITPSGQKTPEIWLQLVHQELTDPVYIKTSVNFHEDRTFFIKFSDPSTALSCARGMILPEENGRTMADIIEPLLLYLLNNKT
ncbi:hypothetical protein A2V80_00565 [Candidatus Woesebacteria bacterium RBG_16_39_8b]|uniref:JAB domain-containing protein n=1 Tax=Candidatus Woesebacteria bacterium RBG_16_39_8b TaxID=1802482 RepID=A0A1F7X8T7_9BACT|nr:MAG: hypothetical protein A2V80_00565 [Candidatus Woesebacteria bacterium RBG_16_39_8b]